MPASWDFTLANYDSVWATLVQIGLLVIALLVGNVLRLYVPLFKKCLVPSALLGGLLLLIINMICKSFDFVLVDKHFVQVVTYHTLGIGFAAMTLKTEKQTRKAKRAQIFEFAALQGGTYMLQAFVGLLITIVMFLLTADGGKAISYICGLILPLAFGQGPGNALTWDINFTNTAATGFAGNGSFGLSLASIGFIVACVFGVIYINYYKKKGLTIREPSKEKTLTDQTNPSGNEIPDNESIDKFSVQIGLVALAYAIAFGIMVLLGILSDFTNSIAWGFNFMWAAIGAVMTKATIKLFRKRHWMSREYINNYQMDRISGFAFDLMIVAGVAAIEIKDIRDYILPIIILTAAGSVITYFYIRKTAKNCFKGMEHEFFLMSFGTLTGTASNGMILMKEIDPSLRTPVSSLYVQSTFPAMILVAPLLFFLNFAASSFTNAIIACAVFFVLFVAYTLFLFRRRILKKRYQDKPEIIWSEE